MGLALAPMQTMWRPLFQWAFAKIFKEQYVTFLRLRWVTKLPQRSSWPTLLKRSTVPGEDEQRKDTAFWLRNFIKKFVKFFDSHKSESVPGPDLVTKPTFWHMFNAVLPTDPTFIQHFYCCWLSYGSTTVLFLSLIHKVTKKEDGKKSQKYVLAINRLLNCLARFNYFIAQLQLSVLHSKESFLTVNPKLWFKQRSIRNFCVQQNTTNYNQH